MKRLFVMGLLFMFMAVAPVVSSFAAEPVVVTNSGPISSVTVAGLVAQNGTPTPNAPVDIVSNNGVLKAGNIYNFATNSALFNANDGNGWYIDRNNSRLAKGASANNTTWAIPCKPNTDYTISYVKGNINNEILRLGWITSPDLSFVNTDISQPCTYVIGVDDGTRLTATIKTGSQATYIIAQVGSASYYQGDIRSALNLVVGNSIGSIYTDGEVETIGDSANNTATVATLLGVGDYRDIQNINTGAITRNVGVKVLDGTEEWSQTDSYSNPWVFYTTFSDGKSGSGTLEKVYCTHFQGVAETNPNMPPESAKITVQGASPTISRFYVKTAAASTIELWKAYLAAQYAAGTPVMIVYPLATETTESVAGQTMTNAPVNNRTGGVTGMTITTLLSSGASVVTTIAANAIKIATTAYNTARFSPVMTDLNSAVATIREIVTKTINQTAAIASLQADKQTRPEDACPAGKKCLLVETEENGVIVPHWFPIIEAPENTE